MPDIEEIIEVLQRRAEELSSAVSSSVGTAQERIGYLLHEEDLVGLPHRISASIAAYANALVDAVTAGGTLPALHLPSLSDITNAAKGHSKLSITAPPPPPPTWFERIEHRIRSRPLLFSGLAALSLSLPSLLLTLHYSSPSFRQSLFAHAPFLRNVYVATSRRRALPPTPRPRLSNDGKHRLESVLVLGCDYGSYGREAAKSFEKKGFIVFATVGSLSEIDGLERSGNGYIKALVLDAGNPASVGAFVRSLGTALSLRYPLHSAGDPFHHISSSSPALSLTSVINCLALGASSGLSGPIEALSSEAISHTLNSTVHTPLAILRSVMPLLRTVHDASAASFQASVITCLPAAERYVGTPFGSAFRGVAASALADALDVLRRELSASNASAQPADARRRNISIINLDVGFLAPVCTKRTTRGNSHSPKASPAFSPQDVEATLPHHLKSVYAPAYIANLGIDTDRWARKRLPGASELGETCIALVLKKRGKAPDRASVGVGVRTYYIASLLPTSWIDTFFSFRQRLLTSAMARKGLSPDYPSTASAAAGSLKGRKRRPLPLPGEASSMSSNASVSSLEAEAEAEHTSSSDSNSRESEGETGIISEASGSGADMHESDTRLPAYAPSEPGSARASTFASGMPSPIAPSQSGFGSEQDGYDSHEEGVRSTVLGESYVRL